MKKLTSIQFIAIIGLLALNLVLFSCEEKDYFDPNYTDPTVSLEPTSLNFSTTQSVKFEYSHDVPEGLVTTFELYSENPMTESADGISVKRDDITPITSGFNVGGSTTTRTLPAYLSEVYMYSKSLFTPTLLKGVIENGVAYFEEVTQEEVETRSSFATRSVSDKAINKYLKPNLKGYNFKENGTRYRGYVPTSIDLTETFPTSVMNNISRVFPSDTKANEIYYADASMYLQQGTGDENVVDVWVSVIHSDGSYNNSLSYFSFKGTKEELAALSTAERSQLKLINAFQYAKVATSTSNTPLKAGKYIKLAYYNPDTDKYEDKFPVGTTIGWVLHSNGFNKPTSGDYPSNNTTYNNVTVKTSQPCFYSIPSWNPEATNNNHTIVFRDTYNDTEYICFGFEDMENKPSGGGDGDCNDVMFHVLTNPERAIDPPPHIPQEGEQYEFDSAKGILAFEDNWPRKGDYDMNDVVVKYESRITYTQKTLDDKKVGEPYVSNIEDKYSLIHTGANYHNSFKVKVEGISLSDVESVTINNIEYNPEANDGGFILEICPLVSKGTVLGGGAIEPYKKLSPEEYAVYNVNIVLKENAVTGAYFNASANKMSKAPYNPYISPSPHIQVHLPNYPPVYDEKMNESGLPYFGMFSDRSYNKTVDPATWNGVWYVSGDNNPHPFAIHLDLSDTAANYEFTIPAELKEISYTYPKYANWIDNGCSTIDADWYLHPDPNADLIYGPAN